MQHHSARLAGSGLRGTVIVVVLALALGLLAGALLLPPLLPKSAQAADGPRAVPVTVQEFTGQHALAAAPALSDEVEVVLSGAGGMITASSCEPGKSVELGNELLGINGTPRWAVVTSVPLWRDLRPGAKGSDVQSLQEALADQDYDVPVNGTYGASTAAAVKKIQKAAGVKATGDVMLDRVQWLPAGVGAVSSCDAPVGTALDTGSKLLVAGGSLVSLSLPASAELENHKYLAVSGESTAEVPEDRKITDAKLLEEIAASPAFSDWKQDPNRGLSLQVRLKEPVQAAGVPPAAVLMSDATHGCVATSQRQLVPAEILSSELGTVQIQLQEPVNQVLTPVSEVADSCK